MSAARPQRAVRARAWVLGLLALAFYVGVIAWNLLRPAAGG
jgi:hypothetical protein